MRSLRGTWTIAAMVAAAALLFGWAAPAAAQFDSGFHGQVLDVEGKPWPDLGLRFVGEQGQKTETKTDKNGKFSVRNLRSGVYVIQFLIPNQAQPYEQQRRVSGGEDQEVIVNFKEIIAKQGAAVQEQMKKQEEEKQKFESMKAHFATGNTILDQARQVRAEMQKAPAEQRDPLKQKLTELTGQAVTEFEAAQKAAGEKDPNMHLLWAKLGEAYDLAGRNEDAAKAYEQAIALKPEVAGYYNNYGNVLARQGKIEEAQKAYVKSAELDPANAANAWRNFGIVLYNAGKMKEAIEPLKKAAEIDPKSAQTWYLLGAALVNTMEFKQVGDKMEVIVPPGTAEAYEKAIELDPNGPYGAQAKQGLEALQQMAPGIQTKFTTKKKKS